jgi:GGDEF domain-containing protein
MSARELGSFPRRFGEEGFAVLLPQTREQDALNIAERFHAHIAAMSIPIDDEYDPTWVTSWSWLSSQRAELRDCRSRQVKLRTKYGTQLTVRPASASRRENVSLRSSAGQGA